MATKYEHLSYEERVLLCQWKKEGHSIREMSRRLTRAASTVSRELRRNKHEQKDYSSHTAQFFTRRRRSESYSKPRLKTKWHQAYVRRKLIAGWSPEQIAGRLRVLGHEPQISHEAIYQYIYDEKPELSRFLLRHHAKRKKFRQSKKKKKTSIPQRTPISSRPADVWKRNEFGHWESDLMVSACNASAVQVTVERKSRLVRLRHLKGRTAAENARELIQSLSGIPKQLLKTLTYDNGPENSQHRLVNQALGTQSYFCDQYASWQKGTVENSIGRLRRRLKKQSNLATLSLQALKRLERQMNQTPRKCLQFRTPMEVWRLEASVALHS
jgi:IS30 family transposase